MKKIIISAVLCVCGLVAYAAAPKPQTLTSPDGKTTVTFDKFKYSVDVDGKQILAPSAISMTLADGTVYGGDAKLVRTLRKTVDQTVPTHIYKKTEVRENYNEMTLVFKAFDLVFRAYDNAVAYRFISKSRRNSPSPATGRHLSRTVTMMTRASPWRSAWSARSRTHMSI